jgi:hypothetical protein
MVFIGKSNSSCSDGLFFICCKSRLIAFGGLSLFSRIYLHGLRTSQGCSYIGFYESSVMRKSVESFFIGYLRRHWKGGIIEKFLGRSFLLTVINIDLIQQLRPVLQRRPKSNMISIQLRSMCLCEFILTNHCFPSQQSARTVNTTSLTDGTQDK